MGYKPWEYYRLSINECLTAISGFLKGKTKQYEHTRAICYTIASVNRDPKKRMPPVDKWWPLPTDDGYVVSRDRALELKEKLARVDEMMKKRNKK